MDTNQHISRNMQSITSHLQVQIGDILLFRPSKKVPFSQKIIMFCQSLIQAKHGHYDTVHAAICSEIGTSGPMLSHVTIVPGEKNAHRQESLQAMLNREGGDRPFLIYRPKDLTLAQAIGRTAQQKPAAKTFKWSFFSAATSLAPHSASISLKPEAIDKNTFCSRFAIQVLKNAYHSIRKSSIQSLANIPTRSTPKKLEAYLNQHSDFQKICYMGADPVATVCEEIEKQLQRLNHQKSVTAKAKFEAAKFCYVKFLQQDKHKTDLTAEEKVKKLVAYILPIFQKNTGYHCATATSYTSLIKAIRKIGIFKNDVSSISIQNRDVTLPQLKLS